MTLVLNGKGLLLEGSNPKIEDKQVPGIYIYIPKCFQHHPSMVALRSFFVGEEMSQSQQDDCFVFCCAVFFLVLFFGGLAFHSKSSSPLRRVTRISPLFHLRKSSIGSMEGIFAYIKLIFIGSM